MLRNINDTHAWVDEIGALIQRAARLAVATVILSFAAGFFVGMFCI